MSAIGLEPFPNRDLAPQCIVWGSSGDTSLNCPAGKKGEEIKGQIKEIKDQ